jgi:hypothetical protein
VSELQGVPGVDVGALRWTPVADSPRSFELRAGDALLARLDFPHSAGSLGHATTASGTYSLKRGGFLVPHVTIRTNPEGPDLARLTAHFGTALLDVDGKNTYRLHRAGLLVPAWQVTDFAATPLVDIEPVADGRRLAGGLATVSAVGRGSPDLLLILVVAWYFILLTWFEDEAVAASRRVLSAVSGS